MGGRGIVVLLIVGALFLFGGDLLDGSGGGGNANVDVNVPNVEAPQAPSGGEGTQAPGGGTQQ